MGDRDSIHPVVMTSQGEHFLAGMQVPYLKGLIGRSRYRLFTIRRDRHSMDCVAVTSQGKQFLAGAQVPHLERLVVSGGDQLFSVWRDCHGVHPVLVSIKRAKERASWRGERWHKQTKP